MDFDRLNRKLKGLQTASQNGHKVRNLWSIFMTDELWYLAYANIYSNHGALTEGIDKITLDGFSDERINKIRSKLKSGQYRPKPVKRVYIPKRDGNKRPLGVPSGDDKLVQAGIKILLETIYEPVFYDTSHGFRPNKSCHTALEQIQKVWTGVKWLIEFDIKGFFDNMNHDIMIHLLEKKIDDKRFIRLIRTFLKSGYLEDWKHHRTYSGTPQGGVVSPILSNIYLHEFDRFVDSLITDFNTGKKRPANPEYRCVSEKIYRLRKKMMSTGKTPELTSELQTLQELQKTLPSTVENTDKYKRLRYCRYADDFICGVVGSHNDTENIIQQIETYLKEELSLTLSPDKTRIERLNKGVEFLGYEIITYSKSNTRRTKSLLGKFHTVRRSASDRIVLRVPIEKVIGFCSKMEYGDYHVNRPIHRPFLSTSSEVEIVERYNAEIRGFANYYSLAFDVKTKLHKLAYIERGSLFKTLSAKRKCQVTQVVRQMRINNDFYLKYQFRGEQRRLKIFQMKHLDKTQTCQDELPNIFHYFTTGSELIRRIESKQCEYCDSTDRPVEVHHVRKLKDLKSKRHLENWEKVMIARHRKTLILCVDCHNLLHQGKLPDKRQSRKA